MTLLRRVVRWLLMAAMLLLVIPVMQVLALRWLNPTFTLTMAQRVIEHSIDQRRPVWVDYQPVRLSADHPSKRAFVASEDALFYAHRGFDWPSICHALQTNTKDRRHGGSTISQQVAKNVFLWQHPSYVRKAIEAYYTLLMEMMLSKERILDVYLNIAETGPLTFGVQAGAQHHFQVNADALTLTQSGQLAGLLPGPQTRSIRGAQAQARGRFVRKYPAPFPTDASFARLDPPLWPTCVFGADE